MVPYGSEDSVFSIFAKKKKNAIDTFLETALNLEITLG